MLDGLTFVLNNQIPTYWYAFRRLVGTTTIGGVYYDFAQTMNSKVPDLHQATKEKESLNEYRNSLTCHTVQFQLAGHY